MIYIENLITIVCSNEDAMQNRGTAYFSICLNGPILDVVWQLRASMIQRAKQDGLPQAEDPIVFESPLDRGRIKQFSGPSSWGVDLNW